MTFIFSCESIPLWKNHRLKITQLLWASVLLVWANPCFGIAVNHYRTRSPFSYLVGTHQRSRAIVINLCRLNLLVIQVSSLNTYMPDGSSGPSEIYPHSSWSELLARFFKSMCVPILRKRFELHGWFPALPVYFIHAKWFDYEHQCLILACVEQFIQQPSTSLRVHHVGDRLGYTLNHLIHACAFLFADVTDRSCNGCTRLSNKGD